MRTFLSLSRQSRLAAAPLTAVAVTAAILLPAASAVATSGAAPLQPAAGQYFQIGGTTVLNTQSGTGGVSGPLASGATATVQVTGVGSIPATGVTDVYMVIRAISPSTSGCINDYNPDAGDPGVCALSFDEGDDASVTDIAQVSENGEVSITNESSGSVGATATVFGYYQGDGTSAAGDLYAPVGQESIVDTRVGLGAPQQQIPGGGSLTVQVTGNGGIPSDPRARSCRLALPTGLLEAPCRRTRPAARPTARLS